MLGKATSSNIPAALAILRGAEAYDAGRRPTKLSGISDVRFFLADFWTLAPGTSNNPRLSLLRDTNKISPKLISTSFKLNLRLRLSQKDKSRQRLWYRFLVRSVSSFAPCEEIIQIEMKSKVTAGFQTISALYFSGDSPRSWQGPRQHQP